MLYINISLSRFTLFLSCLLLVSCGQHADNSSGTDLSYKLSIGDKRAFLNFPAKAKREQKFKQPSIVVPVDDIKIWFFCDELTTTGSAAFFEDVKKKEKPELKKTFLVNNDTLTAVLLTPIAIDTCHRDFPVINRLLVNENDNSMYEITVCISSADIAKAGKAQLLSQDILKTLRKGTKPADLSYRKPREITIEIPGTKKHFKCILPANYYSLPINEGRLISTGFYRYSAYADSSICRMTLRIQNIFRDHPGSTWIHIDEAERTKGKFIGMPISWLTTYGKSHSATGLVYERAQDINCEQIEAGCIVQFEMMSNNKAVIEELTTLAESFKLENQ